MNSNGAPLRRAPRKTGLLSLQTILAGLVISITSFYSGLMLGVYSTNQQCQECLQQPLHNGEKQAHSSWVPPSMSKLFAGSARVDRNAFFKEFDVGVPKDPTTPGNQEVLMLYSHQKTIPHRGKDVDMPKLSPQVATENCKTLKVVLTQPNRPQECLALVGQWESYHVQKWMRLPENNGHVDPHLPLRPVSRLTGDRGALQNVPPLSRIQQGNAAIVSYLQNLPTVLEELKPIAQKVARNNTIVVMVCNHGQSELLMNFVCSAKSRGLDLSQVLVFATDEETMAISEGLGLTAFYDKLNYQDLPKRSAKRYADKTFSGMMMAKIYCVHQINLLGYDLLFQDVDMIWFKNPLPKFVDGKYDFYFQADGAHSVRYAPYDPNSGFYFCRYNERTQYFLQSLLMGGPSIIATTGSHQNAVAAFVNEHVSWRGLRVKTLTRDEGEFPGGWHYHNGKKFMKDLFAGKEKPYIFHMSWTANKDNKKLYLEQMGEWFVQHECVSKTADRIGNKNIVRACCSAKPLIECHYRDKPSKIPCKSSPPIDKGKPSWW